VNIAMNKQYSQNDKSLVKLSGYKASQERLCLILYKAVKEIRTHTLTFCMPNANYMIIAALDKQMQTHTTMPCHIHV
jgi:hypothetical protein